jgi:molybdenum cofactor biosynthesis enzyme MoaA
MYEKMLRDSVGKTSPFIRDKLRISLTNACNRRCFYCHNEGQGHDRSGGFLSVQTVCDLADYCRRGGYRIKKINLTGGEPLLHPQLETIVAELSTVADSLRLNTNAILLDEERIDRLIALGISEFKIGVDSFWSEEDCGYIKNDNLRQLSATIGHIRRSGGRVVMNMVVTPYNQHLIDEMIELSQTLGAEHLKIIEQVDFNFFREPGYAAGQHQAYFEAYEKYRRQCLRFIPDVDAGMDDMVLDSGMKLRWCESFCRSRACGTMYTILNAEGAIVTCSKSAEQRKIDFSPSRSVADIDEDIRLAHEEICCVSGRRYLRDINGVRLPEESARQRGWEWEKEEKDYWRKPEPIVYALARRWRGKGDALLDLGCGMGRNAFAFAAEGFRTVAVDSAAYAAAEVEKAGASGVTALCADMSRLPLRNDSVDFIFAFNTLSHADDYLLALAVREMLRVLRPGGEAWLTLCSKEAEGWRDETAPLVAEHTKLKQKPGPEFGVPHYYADLDDVRRLFGEFELLDVRHVEHCFYDGEFRKSRHFEILLRKPEEERYQTALRSRGE